MMAQLVAGKAARDALFLSTFGVKALPGVMGASAVAAFVAVIAAASAITRWGPARVMPWAFTASALLYLIEWAGFSAFPPAAALAMYLHVVALGAVLSSGFWSLFNERFDPHTAKVLVGRITIGGSLGGLVGGVVGWQLASLTSVPAVLGLLAGLNVLAAWASSCVGAAPPVSSRRDSIATPGSVLQGIKILHQTPFLVSMGLLVLSGAAAQAVLDYLLGLQASRVFDRGTLLMSFFSAFYVGTGALSLVLQVVANSVVLERFGLGGALGLLPAGVVVSSIAALFVPGLPGAALARGAEAVARNSVYRAGYELLYTPIPPEHKRPTKALIDVGFDRLGSALGSAVVMGVIALGVRSPVPLLILVACLGFTSILITLRLRKGYVAALAQGLHTGVMRLDPSDVKDSTTLQTLTATSQTLDRTRLLREIDRLQRQGLIGDARKSRPRAPEVVDTSAFARAVQELSSGEPERIRVALAVRSDFEQQLIPHVIPLLTRDEVARPVIRFLRLHAPKITGQLVDTLLDGSQPAILRKRMARVLKACPSQRALDGLLEGTKDSSFQVRLACARAIHELTERTPGLEVRAEVVHERVVAELSGTAGVEASGSEDDDAEGTAQEFIENARDSRIEAALLLLATTLDREPLILAAKALRTEDPSLRGTALEYLDNVLPDRVREAVFKHLDVKEARKAAPRSRGAVIEDLLKSRVQIDETVKALRRRVHGP